MGKLPDPYAGHKSPTGTGSVVRADFGADVRAAGDSAVRTAEMDSRLAGRNRQSQLQNINQETDRKLGYLKAKENQGVVMQEIGDYVYRQSQEYAVRRDRSEYAKAKNEFLKQKTLLDAQFENDNDFATFNDRYTKGIQSIRDKTAEGISNNRIRQSFIEEAELDMAQGAVKVNTLALAKERDISRAELTANLSGTLEAIYRAPDEYTRENLIASANTAIEFAHANNYIDAQEAEITRKNFTTDYARTRAKAVPPSELLNLLEQDKGGKKSWISYIPPDERVELYNAAKEETVKQEAFSLADGYMKKGYTLEQGYAVAAEIKDPELRAAVEDRFEKVRIVEDRRIKEAKYTQFMGTWVDIMRGNKSVDDMTREELMQFDQPQINAMRAAEEDFIRGKQRTATDLDVIYKLESAKQRKNYDEMMDILQSEDINRMTRKDAEDYLKIAAVRDVPVELKPFFTAKEELTFQLKAAGVSGTKESGIRQEFTEWYQLYQQQNKKEPSRDEYMQFMYDSFQKVGGEGMFNMADIPSIEQPGVLTEQYIQQRDKAGYERTFDEFVKSNGRKPSPRELVDSYKNVGLIEMHIRERDPQGYGSVFDAFKEVEKRDPSPAELIENYREWKGL